MEKKFQFTNCSLANVFIQFFRNGTIITEKKVPIEIFTELFKYRKIIGEMIYHAIKLGIVQKKLTEFHHIHSELGTNILRKKTWYSQLGLIGKSFSIKTSKINVKSNET